MDLRGMINDADEMLHRGSVDRSGDEPTERTVNNGPTSQIPRQLLQRQSNDDKSYPVWAGTFRGRANKVNDPKIYALAVTRPELVAFLDNVSRRNTKDDDDDGEKDSEESELNKISPFCGPPMHASDVGPGGNISLTGLTASIASLIPNDDQTRVLAGWLYEKIQKVADEDLHKLEIEFKIGVISLGSIRHKLPSLSETVIAPTYWKDRSLRFVSDVSPQHFKSLETLLDSLALSHAASAASSIERVNTLTRDEQHVLTDGKVRVSYNQQGDIVECIRKTRIGDLYLAQPNCKYDLKMSLSIERRITPESVREELKTSKPVFERNKNRLEWRSRGCQADLTSVNGTNVATKEVEVETNMQLLGDVLTETRRGNETGHALDKFFEVIRYSVDSARYLSRNI